MKYSNGYNTLVPEGSSDVEDLVQKGEEEANIGKSKVLKFSVSEEQIPLRVSLGSEVWRQN